MSDTAGLLRLLGDETRLRLLRVLSCEALNVSELTAILGLAQSGVSRHLGLLRDAGLVLEERAGTFAWYRLSPAFQSETGDRADLWRWLRAGFGRRTAAGRADDTRLEEVRRLRKENFSQHGGGDERRQLVPGRSWAAWGRALGLLLPPAGRRRPGLRRGLPDDRGRALGPPRDLSRSVGRSAGEGEGPCATPEGLERDVEARGARTIADW